jgi:hypothetical protein
MHGKPMRDYCLCCKQQDQIISSNISRIKLEEIDKKIIIKQYLTNGRTIKSNALDLSSLIGDSGNNFDLNDIKLNNNVLLVNYTVDNKKYTKTVDLSSLTGCTSSGSKDIIVLHENSIISNINIYSSKQENCIELKSIYDYEHVIYVALDKYDKIYCSIYCDNLYDINKEKIMNPLTFKLNGKEIDIKNIGIKLYGHYKIENIEFVISKNGINLLKKPICINFDEVELQNQTIDEFE